MGVPALLQAQEQGINVSAQLRKHGKPELIRFTPTQTKELPIASETPQVPRTNKFGVAPVEQRTADEIVFSSKREMQFYNFLKMLQLPFTRQNRYELQPAFIDCTGKSQKPIYYYDDFCLKDDAGTEYTIDVKGMETTEFKLKRKLFLFHHRRPLYCFKTITEFYTFLVEKKLIVKP